MDGREGGFIKLHRQIKSWWLWRRMTALQRQVVIEILVSANWKPHQTWHGFVGRGELAQSEETIAQEAKVSRKVVRQTIALLVREGFLQTREVGIELGSDREEVGQEKGQPKGRKPRVLTIVNYERYQGWDDGEGQRQGQPRAQRGPSEGPARAPLEEGEERKEEDPAAAAAPPREQEQPLLAAVETLTPKPKRGDPAAEALRDQLAAVYREAKGEELDWPRSAWGDLAAIRKALADDAEVLRRWRLFLADAYWPMKSINRFRAAFQHAKFQRPAAVAEPAKFPPIPVFR